MAWWDKDKKPNPSRPAEDFTSPPPLAEPVPAAPAASPAPPPASAPLAGETPSTSMVQPAHIPQPVAPKPPTEKVRNMETNTKGPLAGPGGQHQTFLGGSASLKGELTADEDLTIEGQFEGSISLQGHCVTVGQHGQVKADITARQVAISGKLNGKVNAQEKIEIRRTGNVVGDLISAGVAIEEGAYFKGSIEILRDEDKPARPLASPTVLKAKAEA